MPLIVSRLIAYVLLIAYSATSLGPRGMALCLGGSHDWKEVIAIACDHGGHSHGDGVEHHHDSSDCAGCEHSHDEQHGPCADIEINVEAGRPTPQFSVKAVLNAMQDSGLTVAWVFPKCHTMHLVAGLPLCWVVVDARHQVMATLRATILLI